jgi:hypothetical protein
MVDDGMCLADALGGKLLHVLIDFCGQSAKFIHAHDVLPEVSESQAKEFLVRFSAKCDLIWIGQAHVAMIFERDA